MTQNTAETFVATLGLLNHLEALSPADQFTAVYFLKRDEPDEVVSLLKKRLEEADRIFINTLCLAKTSWTGFWPWKFLRVFREAKAKRDPLLSAHVVWATRVARHREANGG